MEPLKMTTAWDTKNLFERIKNKALPIAGLVAADLVDWAAESFKLSDKRALQMLGGVVSELKEPLMKEINKHLPEGPQQLSLSMGNQEKLGGPQSEQPVAFSQTHA